LSNTLEDTIEALKRDIARNPMSDKYRKALKGTEARLNHRQANPGAWQEHPTYHKGSNTIVLSAKVYGSRPTR